MSSPDSRLTKSEFLVLELEQVFKFLGWFWDAARVDTATKIKGGFALWVPDNFSPTPATCLFIREAFWVTAENAVCLHSPNDMKYFSKLTVQKTPFNLNITKDLSHRQGMVGHIHICETMYRKIFIAALFMNEGTCISEMEYCINILKVRQMHVS